jgi:hypothetical protein
MANLIAEFVRGSLATAITTGHLLSNILAKLATEGGPSPAFSRL